MRRLIYLFGWSKKIIANIFGVNYKIKKKKKCFWSKFGVCRYNGPCGSHVTCPRPRVPTRSPNDGIPSVHFAIVRTAAPHPLRSNVPYRPTNSARVSSSAEPPIKARHSRPGRGAVQFGLPSQISPFVCHFLILLQKKKSREKKKKSKISKNPKKVRSDFSQILNLSYQSITYLSKKSKRKKKIQRRKVC